MLELYVCTECALETRFVYIDPCLFPRHLQERTATICHFATAYLDTTCLEIEKDQELVMLQIQVHT